MDYYSSGSISEATLSDEEYATCMGQTLDGLAHLRENGVAHRDLKPENILIEIAPHLKVVIADFRMAKDMTNTLILTWYGSPRYIAPEISWNSRHRSEVDIWSLGVMGLDWICGLPDEKPRVPQQASPLEWAKALLDSACIRYLVDGNALFLTAAEAAWRRASGPHFQGGGIIVAVGYPLTNRVFSPRRNYDLTPPRDSPTSAAYGGADHLLNFIQKTVKPFITREVVAGSTLGREALFGHSFGGLFCLYALYTQPSLFDCFLSSSPSIWWDDFLILEYEKQFREGKWAEQDIRKHRPALTISFGSWEQHVPRWSGETEEDYQKRRDQAEEWGMEDNTKALYSRLRSCEFLSGLVLKEYPEEDHGTVIACALSRFLTTFFEEWPIQGVFE